MSNAAAPEDVEKLSFEDALDELERITAEMASGNATLDQSVKSYERVAQLLKRCRAELNRARQSIERIRVEDGEVKRQTSDASASEAPSLLPIPSMRMIFPFNQGAPSLRPAQPFIEESPHVDDPDDLSRRTRVPTMDEGACQPL